jgi:hypothetical protein
VKEEKQGSDGIDGKKEVMEGIEESEKSEGRLKGQMDGRMGRQK